jgi:hypothetical protein
LHSRFPVRLHHGLDRARKERSNLRPRLPLTRRAGCQWLDIDSGARCREASKCGKYGVRNRPRNHKGKPPRPAKQNGSHLRVRLPFPVQVHAPHLPLLPRLHPLPTRPLSAGQQGEAACSRQPGTNRAASRLPLPARRPLAPPVGSTPLRSPPFVRRIAWGVSSFSGEFPAFLCSALRSRWFGRASAARFCIRDRVPGSFYALLSAETGDP